ncbi:PKD domain-containing protein [Humibacillus xanthopallidus]|nr:PKD domain-containing protein [Humibacillus xanthopallidus]
MGALVPTPPKSDAVWGGHNDGAIYQCLVAGSDVNGDRVLLFWAGGPPPAAPPPDPRVLARQAVTAMQLKAVTIGIVPEPRPGSVGIIGLPTWMWVDGPAENTWGPITRTASAGGFTVRATAKVKKIVWDMGDGTQVVCLTKGTPYADSFGRQSSPDCGHTYTRQGSYAVTATSYWSVTWTGVGESGVIPLDLSRTTNITMGEAQVINR